LRQGSEEINKTFFCALGVFALANLSTPILEDFRNLRKFFTGARLFAEI